ncbi:DivIVA domain-containing protein [Micromonospora endolithica]|uniref:DivIVA domain-containing protein n=1 Tax=Micromonospora endolithica TaxID=230091 RepID=A0A3A9ZLP8_9ACTN|nr:DivIVA domain-containing protein [Micromonospora endolithica]RKN48266.1 DivIVA domain-containing protein [Micromonospora endolithica]TWJ24680.1 DivIVA domain-containing protein [Micromonospora endolithica]
MESYEFPVMLRGYDRREVDSIFTPAIAALAATDPRVRAEAAAALRRANPTVALRGYGRAQVDSAITRIVGQLEGPPGPVADSRPPGEPDPVAEFAVALRGYDTAAVDRLVDQVCRALASESAIARAEAATAIRAATFTTGLRGYDKRQVDRFLDQAARALG